VLIEVSDVECAVADAESRMSVQVSDVACAVADVESRMSVQVSDVECAVTAGDDRGAAVHPGVLFLPVAQQAERLELDCGQAGAVDPAVAWIPVCRGSVVRGQQPVGGPG
jgi:hypothetical protein